MVKRLGNTDFKWRYRFRFLQTRNPNGSTFCNRNLNEKLLSYILLQIQRIIKSIEYIVNGYEFGNFVVKNIIYFTRSYNYRGWDFLAVEIAKMPNKNNEICLKKPRK